MYATPPPPSMKRAVVNDTSPNTVLPSSLTKASPTREDDRSDVRARDGAGSRSMTTTPSTPQRARGETDSLVDVNHQRLVRPIAPSAENDGLQRRVSELRVALQTAERVLDRTQSRLELAESARRAAEAESATLRARVWSLEGSEALAAEALNGGSIDALRGRLLQEAVAELTNASKVTTAADHKVQALSQDCNKLQDTIAALSAASAAENETLAIELEQARMRIRSDAREVIALTERATQAEANSVQWRGSNELANSAILRYQTAEKEVKEAKETLAETMRHNEFLQGRVSDLQAMTRSDATSHYGQELRRVREQLGNEISRLNAELKHEQSARKALENTLPTAMLIGSSIDAERSTTALSNEALQMEKNKNAELMHKIEQLKARLAKGSASSSKDDDWSNALGLSSDDEDERQAGSLARSNHPQMRDALLEAARLEVLKLGEMNRKLMQAKVIAEKEGVSKQTLEAALTRNNEAWASKVAAIELEATKIKEQLSLIDSQKSRLEKECEMARLELDDARTQIANSTAKSNVAATTLAALEEERRAKDKIAKKVAEAVQEAKGAKARLEHLQTTIATAPRTEKGTNTESWLKHLPRRHSSPRMSEPDNTLACLGSWASLKELEEDAGDLCRMEDEEVNVGACTLEREKWTSNASMERMNEIRERLGTLRAKPPLSPLKASQEVMERSIREGRLAMEAMRTSRTSSVGTSTYSLKKILPDNTLKRNV